MKKTFRIVAFLLAMLMMLAMFAGCNKDKKKNSDEDVDNTPQAVFRNALAGFVTDLGEMPAIKSWLNMCQHGSLEMKAEIDAGRLAASMGETGVYGHINAGGKFYYSSTGMFIQNLNMDIYSPADKIDVKVSGDIYMGTDYAYIRNDNILGGTIGFVAGETAKAFENAGWKDQIPTESFDTILQILKIYDGEMNEAAEDAIEEIKPVVERYISVISASLEKNAKFTEEIKTVSVGGEDVESRVVTLTVDEKAVVGFINDLYAEIKNDSELRGLIVKYGDMLKDYTGGTGEEMAQMFDQMLAELGPQLDSLEDEIPPFAIMASVATPKDASTLRKLEVSMREGAEDAKTATLVTLDAGKGGVKDTNRVELNIMDETIVAYNIDQNDESGYKASLVVNSYGDVMTLFAVDVNKQAGTYTLSIPEAQFAMGGTFKVDGDKTTIVFNSLTLEGEIYNQGFSMTLVIDENDEIPNVIGKDQVTNVFTLTEKDFEAIVDRFEKVFGDLIGEMGGAKEDPIAPIY